ncbi:MAG: cation-transporting P-type ATPase, partial [Acidiphilium sp.]|nr:cation-transporting P-type ATPase [Acidiphilium sp.]
MNDASPPATAADHARHANGLSSAQAAARFAQYGPNATPDTTVGFLPRLLGKFWAPVPVMLEAAIVLQIVLGDDIEAAVVAALLLFNATLGLLQEGRAQATLDALKSRLALSA